MFTVLSALAGLALIALSLRMRSRARQCAQWPSVTGVVVESRMDDTHLETTKPVLRYRYDVDGQTYTGFRVAFAGYGVSRAAMEALIHPYPVGATVRVYHDPRDPSSAVLDTAARSDWWYWCAFGVGFLALAVWLVRR